LRRIAPVCLIVSLCVSPLLGCGPDKTERGLVTTDEVAAPNSPAEDALTDKQREQQVTDEEQKAADKVFDDAAGGAPKPAN
jgi:hypothetical protein